MSITPTGLVCRLRVAAIAVLVFATSASAESTERLFNGLESAASKSTAPEASQALRTIAGLKTAAAQGHYADVDQYLTSMRSTSFGSQADVSVLIDRLRVALLADAAAEGAKRAGEIDRIVSDAAAKFLAHAPAKDYDLLLKRLGDVPVTPAQYNDPSLQKLEAARSFITRCQDYAMMTSRGNRDAAVNALNELVQLCARLPVLPRSALLAMQADANGAGKDNPAAAKLEALRQSLAGTIDTAKSPADFDAILTELNLAIESGRNSYGNSSYQFETLRRYAARWQDYFSQLEAGNATAAQNILRELANETSNGANYPRSKILTRLNGKAPATATPPVSGEPLLQPNQLSLDNLDKFSRQLRERRADAPGGDSLTTNVLGRVDRIRAVANQLKLGNYRAIASFGNTFSMGSRAEYDDSLERLENELVLRAVPMAINPPADLQPRTGENVEAYIGRVIQYGRQHKDWQLVYRALVAEQDTWRGSNRGSEDATTYNLFFTALNEEAAGQWTLAVRDYLGTLRITNPNVPAEEIGARLERIKAEHPKEYEQADQELGWRGYRGGAPVPGFHPGMPYPAGSGNFRPGGYPPGATTPGDLAGRRPRATTDGVTPPPPAEPAPDAAKKTPTTTPAPTTTPTQ